MKHLLRLRPLFSHPPSVRLSTAVVAVDNASDHLISQSNLVIPRLCKSNNLSDAINLLSAVLTTTTPNLPPSFSILADHLTSHPTMADFMSLLNRLKYNSATQSSLLPVTLTLIDSYLQKRRPKEAVKVFSWMIRPDSVCAPDMDIYRVLISGLFDCRAYFDGLRVLREMIRAGLVPGSEMIWAGLVPGSEMREVVYRGLLVVAMVREVVALNGALAAAGVDDALKLLDDIISKWED